jgi:hypothetical protein
MYMYNSTCKMLNRSDNNHYLLRPSKQERGYYVYPPQNADSAGIVGQQPRSTVYPGYPHREECPGTYYGLSLFACLCFWPLAPVHQALLKLHIIWLVPTHWIDIIGWKYIHWTITWKSHDQRIWSHDRSNRSCD